MTLTRRFVDSDGVHWQVYEVADRRAMSQPGTWLYFFSRGITRTLALYPDDWSGMDWPGLERLCRAATTLASAMPDRTVPAAHAAEV